MSMLFADPPWIECWALLKFSPLFWWFNSIDCLAFECFLVKNMYIYIDMINPDNVYLYKYVYIYTYIYICICVYIYTFTWIHTIHIWIQLHISQRSKGSRSWSLQRPSFSRTTQSAFWRGLFVNRRRLTPGFHMTVQALRRVSHK